MKVSIGPKFNPSENLLEQDLYHMLTPMGMNVAILHATHPSERAKYLILVDTTTGSSLRVEFEHGVETKLPFMEPVVQ